MLKIWFFAGILKVNDENSRIRIQDPNPLVRRMDPRIRIHPKISWIRNTVENCAKYYQDPEPEPKSEPEPQQIIAVPQHCSLAPFATIGLWILPHNELLIADQLPVFLAPC